RDGKTPPRRLAPISLYRRPLGHRPGPRTAVRLFLSAGFRRPLAPLGGPGTVLPGAGGRAAIPARQPATGDPLGPGVERRPARQHHVPGRSRRRRPVRARGGSPGAGGAGHGPLAVPGRGVQRPVWHSPHFGDSRAEATIRGFEDIYGWSMPYFAYYEAAVALKIVILTIRDYSNGKTMNAPDALPGFLMDRLRQYLGEYRQYLASGAGVTP